MKRKYLVVYDYGQGGIWMFFLARSPNEILEKYPALKVVDPIPTWRDESAIRRIEHARTFDIDEPPHGWLALHVNECAKRGYAEASDSLMTSTVGIYVRLLNEGVDVWRPVQAERMGDIYRVREMPDSYADETWEFKPGEIVHCEYVESKGERILAAVKRIR